MKLRMLALSILMSFSVMAEVKIPEKVLEIHKNACPLFESEDAQYLVKESFQLPHGEYSKVGPTLYLLGCELYAYNSSERAYLVNSYGDVTNVSIVDVDGFLNLSATDILMGAGFDLETLTLGTFSKGRGLGDCGSSSVHAYDKNNEKFVLVEARLKAECDGSESDWPVIYKK